MINTNALQIAQAVAGMTIRQHQILKASLREKGFTGDEINAVFMLAASYKLLTDKEYSAAVQAEMGARLYEELRA